MIQYRIKIKDNAPVARWYGLKVGMEYDVISDPSSAKHYKIKEPPLHKRIDRDHAQVLYITKSISALLTD